MGTKQGGHRGLYWPPEQNTNIQFRNLNLKGGHSGLYWPPEQNTKIQFRNLNLKGGHIYKAVHVA